MARVEFEPKLLVGRELLTPIDALRASDFAVGSIVSGGNQSGGGVNLKIVSSAVKMRPVALHLFNNEGGWLEVVFHDGGFAGGRVLGPFRIQPLAEYRVPPEDLLGRYFTSSIYSQVRSGWTAQPLSTGVQIEVSWVPEPTDLPGQ